MQTSPCCIEDFIASLTGKGKDEIILAIDAEATKAERYSYRHCSTDLECASTYKSYAHQLKELLLFFRHGVVLGTLKKIDLSPFFGTH